MTLIERFCRHFCTFTAHVDLHAVALDVTRNPQGPDPDVNDTETRQTVWLVT